MVSARETFEIPARGIEEQRQFAVRLKAQLAVAVEMQGAAKALADEIERLPARLLARAINTH